MAKIVYGAGKDRVTTFGVEDVVLFTEAAQGSTPPGYGWNGVTDITLTPDGGESTDIYADNEVYTTTQGKTKVNGNIKAYFYPDEWKPCDGQVTPADGFMVGNQPRQRFNMAFKRVIKDELTASDLSEYQLWIVYNCLAQSTEQMASTITETNEPYQFSWDFKATPIRGTGATLEALESFSYVMVDSRDADPTGLATLIDSLYGTDAPDAPPVLLTPEAVLALVNV